MKRSRPVAHKATKPTLEGEIAQLRDLDLKGLRLRWQSMFRRQAPSHLPRHLLLAVMAHSPGKAVIETTATDHLARRALVASGPTPDSRRDPRNARRRDCNGAALAR